MGSTQSILHRLRLFENENALAIRHDDIDQAIAVVITGNELRSNAATYIDGMFDECWRFAFFALDLEPRQFTWIVRFLGAKPMCVKSPTGH